MLLDIAVSRVVVLGLAFAALTACTDDDITTTTQGSRKLTSCDAVTHIGDSLTVGMTAEGQIQDPNDRLVAQYHQVGVADVNSDGGVGRTIHEITNDQEPGVELAANARERGFTGCWVIELGTNDTALIIDGSTVGARQRIDEMMAVIGDEPVMWVTSVTVTGVGSYASEHMEVWNAALRDAQPTYPNLELYDWATVAQPEWFAADGIHYTSAGFTQMAHRIPEALAARFPA